MRRRQFVRSSMFTLGSALLHKPIKALATERSAPSVAPDPAVRRVLAMFKCHFDAGFIDTQAHVVDRYFNQFFPQAIRTAEQMRQSGAQRYVWTTGSWLLYEYLEQASAKDRRRMEQAIGDGDIAWHALPFSWQTEMMDRSLISGSLALSRSLDKRFDRTTVGAKMTDVPGHTRGLIRPLADHNVTFLDVGVNGGSTRAELPPLFVWKDPDGASMVVMYHHEYGTIARVPGSELAIAIMVRGDNAGPHTPQEIAEIYQDLGQRFPNAQIQAANLTEIANAVQPYRSHLPIVTQEIGDTWIYGVASDPLKVARYRELCRLRQSWISKKQFQSGDATDLALLRHLLLEVEHTWGTDTKTWLDFDNYTPHDLAPMLDTKNYKVVEFSWQEKRRDLFDGIATLPAPLQQEARTAISNLAPKPPSMTGSVHSAVEEIETKHFILQLDPATGAIRRLKSKQTSREWASAEHPLALFSYQTLSQNDYQQFLANYLTTKADWAEKDFGKPNIERFGAVNQTWWPKLDEVRVQRDRDADRVTARLHIDDAEALESGRAAFPRTLYLELILLNKEPVVDMNFYWFDKAATRMPEALWLTFNPAVTEPKGWSMDKSGQQVSPLDVVAAGSRHQHAVTRGFGFADAQGGFQVETLDAPLIALGEKSPLNFSRSQPDLSGGIHCCLFNNAWGTNYIMWFSEDMRFRFQLRA
jgi:hypothetical protein